MRVFELLEGPGRSNGAGVLHGDFKQALQPSKRQRFVKSMPRQQTHNRRQHAEPPPQGAPRNHGAGAIMLVAALAFNLPDTLRGAVEDPKAAEDLEKDVLTGDTWVAPEAKKRCEWISDHYAEKDSKLSKDDLHTKYKAQGKDANSFYRATADLFWHDFVNGGWGEFDLLRLATGRTARRCSDEQDLGHGRPAPSNFARSTGTGRIHGMNDFDEAVRTGVLRHRRDSCPFENGSRRWRLAETAMPTPRRTQVI